jgi:uncharacterized membrane protein
VSDKREYDGPRWLAFLLAAISAVTLIAAAVNTPLSDWKGATAWSLAAGLIAWFFWFAIQGVRGGFNLVSKRSKRSLKTSSILNIVSIFLFLIVALLMAFSVGSEPDVILVIGLFAGFITQSIALGVSIRRQMKLND